jgi:uncharacterized protein YgfB (UPF0149 family)
MRKVDGPRKRLGVLAMVGLLFVAAVPAGIVVAEPAEKAGQIEMALEQLSELLMRLEAELAALERPQAERLEQRLEEVIELIENLLAEFDQPREEDDGAALKARIIKLDLMLHRLVHVLDEVVEAAGDTPARPRAKGALDDLRGWVNGYIDGLTAGMPPRAADRLEKAVHEMVRDMAHRIGEMAQRAQGQDRPVLGRLVERLEELLFRLDGFILKRFQQRP